MRAGRGHDEQPDLSEDPAGETLTSELGWAAVNADPRRWIPCPVVFPDGWDRDSWADAAAIAWSEQWGLPAQSAEVQRLTTTLRVIHERALARVKCHQVWIYLPDCFTAPLPVFIAIWRQSGARDVRLRALTGADDPPGGSRRVRGAAGAGAARPAPPARGRREAAGPPRLCLPRRGARHRYPGL